MQQNVRTVDNSDFGNQEEVTDENIDLSSVDDTVYHLILEGLDVAYKIDSNSNVHVYTVTVSQKR